jgi:hypothetical protein
MASACRRSISETNRHTGDYVVAAEEESIMARSVNHPWPNVNSVLAAGRAEPRPVRPQGWRESAKLVATIVIFLTLISLLFVGLIIWAGGVRSDSGGDGGEAAIQSADLAGIR